MIIYCLYNKLIIKTGRRKNELKFINFFCIKWYSFRLKFGTFFDCKKHLLKIETEILPDFKNKNYYDELFGIYKQAYPVLKSLFDSLSAIKSC